MGLVAEVSHVHSHPFVLFQPATNGFALSACGHSTVTIVELHILDICERAFILLNYEH